LRHPFRITRLQTLQRLVVPTLHRPPIAIVFLEGYEALQRGGHAHAQVVFVLVSVVLEHDALRHHAPAHPRLARAKHPPLLADAVSRRLVEQELRRRRLEQRAAPNFRAHARSRVVLHGRRWRIVLVTHGFPSCEGARSGRTAMRFPMASPSASSSRYQLSGCSGVIVSPSMKALAT